MVKNSIDLRVSITACPKPSLGGKKKSLSLGLGQAMVIVNPIEVIDELRSQGLFISTLHQLYILF